MSYRQMMDEVIKTFGFEDDRTFVFCELCEGFDEEAKGSREVEEMFKEVLSL